MKSSKGFTLIELLVVIAIIGILSSVVLASLNTARNKGSNAAIKSQLAAIRAQAEIFYDTFSSYGTSTTVTSQTATAAAGCSAVITNSLYGDNTISNMIKGLVNTGGTGTVFCMVNPTTTNTAWSVTTVLKVTEGTYTNWCADSTGASKGETSSTMTLAACP